MKKLLFISALIATNLSVDVQQTMATAPAETLTCRYYHDTADSQAAVPYAVFTDWRFCPESIDFNSKHTMGEEIHPGHPDFGDDPNARYFANGVLSSAQSNAHSATNTKPDHQDCIIRLKEQFISPEGNF